MFMTLEAENHAAIRAVLYFLYQNHQTKLQP